MIIATSEVPFSPYPQKFSSPRTYNPGNAGLLANWSFPSYQRSDETLNSVVCGYMFTCRIPWAPSLAISWPLLLEIFSLFERHGEGGMRNGKESPHVWCCICSAEHEDLHQQRMWSFFPSFFLDDRE